MTLVNILTNVALAGDRALDIDYSVSPLPTVSGIRSSATAGAKYGYQIARQEALNKPAICRGVRIAFMASAAYASLC